MKKCTLILMVILTITACKKEKADTQTITAETAITETTVDTTCNKDSISLEKYYERQTIEEKVQWLKDSGKLVCKRALKEAVLRDHKLQGTIISKTGKYTEKWGKLRGMIKDHRYENYLNVKFKGKTITGLEPVTDYIPQKDSGYCFSPVLIRSLGEEHAKKNDNAEFQFSFATVKINNKKIARPVVVIQVIADPGNTRPNDEDPYYDYSTDPKKKKKLNTPNIPL